MLYLSELLNKTLYFKGEKYAKIIDFGLPEELHTNTISTVLVKKDGKKQAFPINAIKYENEQFDLISTVLSPIVYDKQDFYLAEDLLDKQVIDVTGSRLVRVNDVLIRENGSLKVVGIDIGFAGILRRLGIHNAPFKAITIPWSQMEAFDYQTGDIKIKLGKSNLTMLHPSDIADILEEAGAKERLGVVEALDAQTAAAALEEANEETQQSILEGLSENLLRSIVQKMPVSEIADIIDELNPETMREIFSYLGKDKAKKLRKLAQFDDNVAGGLMTISFVKVQPDTTIAETLGKLINLPERPEGIIVVTNDDILVGIVETKNLLNMDPHLTLKEIMKEPFAVHQDTPFSEILKLFAEYNLRVLPVVDETDKVVGVILIDTILGEIQEEEVQDVEI